MISKKCNGGMMSFIKAVRVRNFRSIRDAEFEVGNLNIFVGQNDAGKSNVLRALNLFFNNHTDYGQPFRFDFDYSKTAVTGKGKAQEIVIDLEILPPPKRFSNAELIVWRKRWRREGTRHDEPIFKKGGREIGPRSNITNWLNKLIFRYVPAVKGEEYFSKLMGELHDVLSVVHSDDFRVQGENFTAGLRGVTETIAEDLERLIGIRNTIQVPSDFKDLFVRLDFGMSEADKVFLLRSRGDGIKARHIPVILKAMAQKEREIRRSGYVNPDTIWGFEEPENNVELSAAFKMAQQFCEFSKDIQIFLTTHSPAFYSLHGNPAAADSHLFHVKQHEIGISIIRPADKVAIDEELGVISLVTPYVKEKNEELNRLQNMIRSLEDRAITARYVVLTEDINYNETKALETLLLASGYEEKDFQIVAYNGAGNINAALGLAVALKARHREVEIIIHRDRDYLSDKEIEVIEGQVKKIGAHPFISLGVDIESHFLDLDHLVELYGAVVDRRTLATLLDEATEETKQDSLERLYTTWFLQNRQDMGKVGKKITELNKMYESNVQRYRYSKKVVGVLSGKLQRVLKKQATPIAGTNAVANQTLKRYYRAQS